MDSPGEVQLDSPSFDKTISKSDEELEQIFRNTGEISELVVVAEGEERTSYFVWLLVACSSISGLLFGRFFFHPCLMSLNCVYRRL
jgi:hypothetical protein